MAKAPSSSGFNAQLMQEYAASQSALNQQTQAYQAQQTAANQAAANAVAQQQAQTTASINAAIAKPASMATILTSPSGALGNPPLALQKLS